MIWALAVILGLLWALAVGSAYLFPSYIHLLIAAAVALVGFRLVRSRGRHRGAA